MSFYDLHEKRLNRYGENYESRVQGKREREFENLLSKSIYRINFTYDNSTRPAILKPMRQDETKTLHYLLVRVDLDIPPGTLINLPDKKGDLKPWLVYWLDERVASGYNRFVVLAMTHLMKWENEKGESFSSWSFMTGQRQNMMVDTTKSRSRSMSLYTESVKGNSLILPANPNLRQDTYFKITRSGITEGYRVTGYDIHSTEGVMYVTVLPTFIRNEDPSPQPQVGDTEEEFFWLQGRVTKEEDNG